jgi:hypothetical protein
MTPTEVEKVYEALALQIDAISSDKIDIYLAKLTLLLAREVGDTDRVRCLISQAAMDLNA